MTSVMTVRLFFIGTGGGRFATIYQTRNTGGFLIEDGQRIHVDPGPGALTNLSRSGTDPALTDSIMISHCHPDHYSDAAVLVEGMTMGGIKRRGSLMGSRSVLEGINGLGPAVSTYHQSMVEDVRILEAGGEYEAAGMKVSATPTQHTDPSGVGMIFHTSEGDVSYVGDTHLREDVVKAHEGTRVLLLSVTRPSNARVQCHLCTEDAVRFVSEVSPDIAILTHMGVRMVQCGPDREASKIAEATGVRTVAARDLMDVRIGKVIRIRNVS